MYMFVRKESKRFLSNVQSWAKLVKTSHPNCLVFTQIGEFYEMFGEDARKGSELLNITLTKRNKGKPDSTDMAGVPVAGVSKYLKRLASLGEKVALVDQTGTMGSKYMDRKVTRIVTPGTLCEDEFINEERSHRSNFLLSCLPGSTATTTTKMALAWTDISISNDIVVQTVDFHDLPETLRKISPVEIVLVQETLSLLGTDNDILNPYCVSFMKSVSPLKTAQLNPSFTEEENLAIETLKQYVGSTLMPGGVMEWTVGRVQEHKFMTIDSHTRTSLDISSTAHSLLHCVDFTSTPGGRRLLRKRLEFPSMQVDTICERLDAVEYMRKMNRFELVQDKLKRLSDPTRALQRLVLGRWNVKDLETIKDALRAGRLLADEVLVECTSEVDKCAGILAGLQSFENDLHSEGVDMVQRALKESGKMITLLHTKPLHSLADLHVHLSVALEFEEVASMDRPRIFAPGFHAGYDELIAQMNPQHTIASLQQKYQTQYAPFIKLRFLEKSGHFVEVPKSAIVKMKPFGDVFFSLRDGSQRFTTKELDKFNRDQLSSSQELDRVERILLNVLGGQVLSLQRALEMAFSSLEVLDVAASSAKASQALNLIRPCVKTGTGELELNAVRHIVVERNNPNFIGNNVKLQSEGFPSVWLITGPNMGGKSTFLRSCALAPILAQAGLFVPCEKANVGLVDQIFARIGASDDLVNNRSTFMVEMQETAHLLKTATCHSLVIVDELGRGTSPWEGLCLAQAVLEELIAIGCRALFATHFHELISQKRGPLEQSPKRIEAYTTEVKVVNEFDLVFTFKIVPGAAESSFGLNVARLAGLPAHVVDRANYLVNQKK